MIKILLDVDSEGMCYGFSVEGHAGYAAKGNDIVCAAVSALTQGMAHALEQIMKPGNCNCITDGKLICTIADPNIVSQAIIAAMRISLEEIENQYGDYVKVCHKQ